MSFYYSLDNECYTWKNALLWGNCIGHVKKMGTGKLGDRIVHAFIALVELVPIVSQIASIAEKILVRSLSSNAPKTNRHLSDKHVVRSRSEKKSSSSIQGNRQVESTDSKEETSWRQALARCVIDDSHPDQVRALHIQAFNFYKNGQYREAEEACENMLSQYKPNQKPARGLFLLAVVKGRLGKKEEASNLHLQANAIYTFALQICPPNIIPVSILNDAAGNKLDMLDFSGADMLYTRIRTEYPNENDSAILINAATVKYRLGEYEAANELILQELAKHPSGQVSSYVLDIKKRIDLVLNSNGSVSV